MRLSVGLAWAAVLTSLFVVLGCRFQTSETADEPRRSLPQRTLDDSGPSLPEARASANAGKRHFESHCVSCHGPDGRGDGAVGRALRPPAPDFTDPQQTQDKSPLRYFEAIGNGVTGSSMKRFDHLLDEQARWDTAYYLWSLGAVTDRVDYARSSYEEHCGRCHGTDGRGKPGSPFDRPESALESRLDTVTLVEGVHPELASGLSDDELKHVVEYLRMFLYTPIESPDDN